MTPEAAYQSLRQRFHRLGMLSEAMAMLSWDRQTVMPAGGAEARAEQLATLSVLHHETLVDPQVGEWLSAAEAEALDDWPAANLREMRRGHAHATALPADLVERLSRATSACEHTWRSAREADDFAAVEAPLAELLGLVREIAERKAAALGKSPYDALLDEYEPDGQESRIDVIFAELAAELPDLLRAVLDRQSAWPEDELPVGPHDTERQKGLARAVMGVIGFEFSHGRLDTSAHPFCGGVPDDVRITTRYDETDFTSALMGIIHESGHAAYERGLPREWRGQPVGQARGMTLHESQSLLMEMQAGRSPAFLNHLTPILSEHLGGEGWSSDALRRRSHRVTRGLIRVEADEVTYPLHIMLRFRLERALLAGRLAVADIPEAWNEGMRDLIGTVPPTDREGCMQDIHWYDGAFGYFPTYTLGALAAAQLFQAAREALPSLESDISAGEFSPLIAWLRENVHRWGSFHDTDGVMVAATGAPLGAAAFLKHLRARYLEG